MKEASKKRISSVVGIVTVAVLALASSLGYAEDKIKVEGIIKARSGATIILETKEDPKLVVLLTDTTSVGQVQGLLKARQKSMSMAALIPGLPVKVEGVHDAQNQLVATEVKFKGNDLEQAKAIQAGMHETKVKNEEQEAELAKQKAELDQHSAELTEQQRKIAENKVLIAQNTARFGQLDDYYIMDEVTVLFPNGSAKVDKKYIAQLSGLAEKAKTVQGYMIEVKGYASATGSTAVNQAISEKRASSVANILIQQGKVPLTNMLAPGAMGESTQVATDKTAEAEAENRRVVVRVLQNKAIAGAQ